MKLKKYKEATYYGIFIHGKRNGLGIMIYDNSRLYEGTFISIQETGNKISNMDMDTKFFLTIVFTKESILKDCHKGLGNILGLTDNFMMDNGKKVLSMDQVCGKVIVGIHILGNGKKGKLMVMVFIHG